VILTDVATQRLVGLESDAKARSARTVHQKKLHRLKTIEDDERSRLSATKLNLFQKRLLCAMIYWCEGAKRDTSIKFTNSDPALVSLFVGLLREIFELDESKFRVIVHIHEYHLDDEQKKFWSNVTKIPLTQFFRSYQKPHTGISKKENYQGCICVNYFDSNVSRHLLSLARQYMELEK
jgi:hypothetical protein